MPAPIFGAFLYYANILQLPEQITLILWLNVLTINGLHSLRNRIMYLT